MNAHLPHLATRMQTRITDQPAYLLHRRDWQNSSLILDLMTLDFGRLSLLAKGGKNSQTRGLYQPFSKLKVSWIGRSELKTLTSIDGSAFPLDERLYLPLLYVNELLATFLPKMESSPELFALYGELLGQINTENTEAMLREFERSLMDNLGYLPDLGIEAEQGDAIDAALTYFFLPTRGFVSCLATEANAIEGEKILSWNEKNYQRKDVRQLAKSIMRSIIDANLQGKPLKSRDIYLQIQRRC